jgi:ATP-dependent exoDNAse (exonuclease V) beta subunit
VDLPHRFGELPGAKCRRRRRDLGAAGDDDGVIFYAKKRVFACGCPQSAATWQKILEHNLVECETKRIAYVALSRAAQSLTIVAPNALTQTWEANTATIERQLVVNAPI